MEQFHLSFYGQVYCRFVDGKVSPKFLFDETLYEGQSNEQFLARFCAFNSEPEGLSAILWARFQGYTEFDLALLEQLYVVNNS